MFICLERGADLHMAQLMPLPLTVSCFSEIQIAFTFLVPAHPGSPGKGPLNGWVCVCVCIILPSVLWHCWSGVRKSIRSVKIGWWGVGVFVCLAHMQIVSIWSSWCHCIPEPPSSLASFESRLVLPFWYWLTKVVLEKRPFNRCNSCSSVYYFPNALVAGSKGMQAAKLCSNRILQFLTRGAG